MVDSLRVLIADDNPAILDMVKEILQNQYQIVAALERASAVIRDVPDLNPDVVVLDISMGDMNGFEVTRLLKDGDCRSKIIFLTVHEELEFIRAAFDAGASGYVFKSRMSADLRNAIDTVHSGRVFFPEGPIIQYSTDTENL